MDRLTRCYNVSFYCRANSRLSEANSRLLDERGRSMISSSSLSLGGSLGLGGPLLAPDRPSSGVEDYLAKVCHSSLTVNPESNRKEDVAVVLLLFLL